MMTRFLRAAGIFVLAAGAARASFVIAPYLQNPGDSSMVVRWQTAAAESGRVEYGLTLGYGLVVADTAPVIDHEVLLTGLQTDTVYHYRVVAGADTSADAVFHSGVSAAMPFRFLVYGDTHGDSATHQSVVDRMALVEPAPTLLVHVGDLTSDGAAARYRTFFRTERGLLSRLPLFPAVGNRDADSAANWHRFLALPGNERWYSFHRGSSAFHSLDANDSLSPGSSQYNWLLDELRDDSASGVRHVFVFLHTPAYTTSTSYSGNATVRQHLCPLFERFGVRVVFSGHVHAYEHSLVNGVHYVTSGGGSASLSTGWNAAQPWTVYREATYEFVVVDVRGDTVASHGVRRDGTVFDSLVLVSGQVACGDSGRIEHPNVSAQFGVGELCLTVDRSCRVAATLYDASGRRTARLIDAMLDSGRHRLSLTGRALPAGAYLCVISIGGRLQTARIVLAR